MTLRLSALVKAAADAPTLPTSVDALDADTLARLEAFAARESLTLDAALAVVRDAQKAARTELRADARVEEAVSTALRRRRLGLVGLDTRLAPAEAAEVDSAVAEALVRRAAVKEADRGE
jgi:hypothetical protein